MAYFKLLLLTRIPHMMVVGRVVLFCCGGFFSPPFFLISNCSGKSAYKYCWWVRTAHSLVTPVRSQVLSEHYHLQNDFCGRPQNYGYWFSLCPLFGEKALSVTGRPVCPVVSPLTNFTSPFLTRSASVMVNSSRFYNGKGEVFAELAGKLGWQRVFWNHSI